MGRGREGAFGKVESRKSKVEMGGERGKVEIGKADFGLWTFWSAASSRRFDCRDLARRGGEWDFLTTKITTKARKGSLTNSGFVYKLRRASTRRADASKF